MCVTLPLLSASIQQTEQTKACSEILYYYNVVLVFVVVVVLKELNSLLQSSI